MTNEQALKEFDDKFLDTKNPNFFQENFTIETIKSFLLSLLHQKDLEKEEALEGLKDEIEDKRRTIASLLK